MADIDMNPAKLENAGMVDDAILRDSARAEPPDEHEPLAKPVEKPNTEVPSAFDRSLLSGNSAEDFLMEKPLLFREDHRLLDAERPGQDPQVGHDGDTQRAPAERTLNVTDALSYLDSVKSRFSDNPDVYNRFLDIMKDFKSQLIDTPGVIERVSNLFHGHLELIQGFNTFLPAGYRIECTTDSHNPNFITVTTPAGTTTQATDGVFAFGNSINPPGGRSLETMMHSNSILPADHDFSGAPPPEVFQPAMSFVAQVKKRYEDDPGRYRQFLEILSDKSGFSLIDGDVLPRIGKLFYDAPDLMKIFEEFLPGKMMQELQLARAVASSSLPAEEGKVSHKRTEGSNVSAAQKRKRKPVERDKEKEAASKAVPSKVKKARSQATVNEGPSPALSQRHAAGPSSPRRPAHAHAGQPHSHHHAPPASLPPPIPVSSAHAPVPLPANDDTHFFDRVKRALDTRETYNEFLKLVNLFTQDIIDRATLVRESHSFLGDSELMMQFKDILGWDEQNDRLAGIEDVWSRPMVTLDRPSRNQLNMRYGSYRKLPANEVNVTCSGRDDMCRSVLNDEWISHPSFASEDAGFVAHKKNVYEEALHRSEEERHEYDFHIEAIHRTIQILEPLSNKIAQLSGEDRANFKMKPNLNGVAKAIHQRVIKKIYGRELGLEVFQLMQDQPALAIPVVLGRLKQKHEEWKRAQREWNKIWREVDARNYHKSLDHQGITFKAADKKAVTAKAFVNQIETAREEQMAKRAALIDPLFARVRPRHQLEFVLEDMPVLQDAVKLTLSFLDRTQGQIPFADRKKVETFLRSFVPLFFVFDPVKFNAFVPFHEMADSDMEVESAADDAEFGSGSSRRGKKAGAASSDLRKKLLKSEQAKSSRRTRAGAAASPAPSRFASPTNPDTMDVDVDGDQRDYMRFSGRRGRFSFFTNTNFYVLFRLLEVLYARLKLFRDLATKLAREPSAVQKPVAASLGYVGELAGLDERATNAAHFYELMMDSCEKLFDNEIEQHVFEDQMRYMFGAKDAYKMFTVDKVIGALIKQVQNILSDEKNQELFDLLRRERDIGCPTSQDLLNMRRNAEKIVGPDENLFRLEMYRGNDGRKDVTIQLLGKDDPSFDDSNVQSGRWDAYVKSFISDEHTTGVPALQAKRIPFLRRNRPQSETPEALQAALVARGGLRIKVCVRTYRLFYEAASEDSLFRTPVRAERERLQRTIAASDARRQKWLADLAAKEPIDTIADTASSSTPAVAEAATVTS